MREIKFRCWDGEKMVTETTEAFHDLNRHVRAFGGAYLMQFTGLLDKNGAEIYEGDLVEDFHGHAYPIEFLEGGFWCRYPNGQKHMASAEWRLIIGNIYEHPHLLAKPEAER